MDGWAGYRAVLSVDTFYNVDKCELLWPINSLLIYGPIVLGLSVVRNGAVSVSAEVEGSATWSWNTAAAARGRKSESMRVSALAPNDQTPATVTSLLEILTSSSNECLNLHVVAGRFMRCADLLHVHVPSFGCLYSQAPFHRLKGPKWLKSHFKMTILYVWNVP